jgi:hypothetical protein
MTEVIRAPITRDQIHPAMFWRWEGKGVVELAEMLGMSAQDVRWAKSKLRFAGDFYRNNGMYAAGPCLNCNRRKMRPAIKGGICRDCRQFGCTLTLDDFPQVIPLVPVVESPQYIEITDDMTEFEKERAMSKNRMLDPERAQRLEPCIFRVRDAPITTAQLLKNAYRG